MGYAKRATEAIRAALREYGGPDEAVEQATQGPMELSDQAVQAGCRAASGQMPLLVCHFGPSASQPVAQAIYWYERGGWQSQLYPQASVEATAERKELLAELGCRLVCYSGIARARQVTTPEGETELLVVADLGFSGGQRAEEPHLLRFVNGQWQMVWAPGAGDWNYGHAQVELTAKGIAQFKVRSTSWLRTDSLTGYFAEAETGVHRRFTEHWMRKGKAYVLANRAEEPTPYGTLVRLVHYLSTGGDEKAAGLLSPDLDLEDARKALAQKPRRQGWTVTRWGDHGFLVDRMHSGRPDLGVRFVRQDDDWLLAEMWTPTR